MKKIIIILASLVFFFGAAHAKEIMFGIQPAIPVHLGGGFDYWKSGFGFGSCLFYSLSSRLSLGAQAVYNFVSPNPSAYVGYSSSGYTFTTIDKAEGRGHVIELAAAIRYYVLSSSRKLSLYLQAGPCFDLMRVRVDEIAGKTKFKLWYGSGTGYTTMHFGSGLIYSSNSLGFSAGSGLSLALGGPIHLEVCPKLTVLFTEGGSTTFLSLSAGLSFVHKIGRR